MAPKKNNKKINYTVSTYCWDNLEDVSDQILTWERQGTLNPSTMVFEVKRKIDLKKKGSECEEW